MDVVTDGHFSESEILLYSYIFVLWRCLSVILFFFADLVYPLQLVSCLSGSEMLDY